MQLPSISSLSLLLSYYTSVAAGLAIAPRDSQDSQDSQDAPSALPRITSVSYSGDGCPSSSPGVERTGAGFGDVGFRLNGFEATLPGIDTSSTACQIHLQASGCSAGWQVGIQSATVKGHLVLDPGASVDWYLTSYWSENAGNTVGFFRLSSSRYSFLPILLLAIPFSLLFHSRNTPLSAH